MKNLRKTDKTLLFFTILFSIFGLIMIFSASSASTVLRYNYASTHFFIRQLVVLIVGFIAGFIIMMMPIKYHKLTVYALTLGILFLLVTVLIKGKVTNNAQSWFKLGSFTVQPSEFAKSIAIIFMGFYFNTIRKSNNITAYFIPIIVIMVMVFLVAYQPDWGSALILLMICMCAFFEVPFVKRNLGKIIKYLSIAFVLALLVLIPNKDKFLTEEKKSRLLEYQNPCERYQEDSGYQVCNGFIAIANGGLLGVGLGKSSQKYLYLPESHTDFIFPIICEECGALVGMMVIISYAIILLRIWKISKESNNVRNKIIAFGTFSYLALHVIVNLLGVLAVIPLTGVPLPLLSYGGSFTLNAIIMLFFVQRVAIENKKEKFEKELAKIRYA